MSNGRSANILHVAKVYLAKILCVLERYLIGNSLTVTDSAASQVTQLKSRFSFSFFPPCLLEEGSLGDAGLQLLHSQEMIPYEV